jgi:hypothetical protein
MVSILMLSLVCWLAVSTMACLDTAGVSSLLHKYILSGALYTKLTDAIIFSRLQRCTVYHHIIPWTDRSDHEP